MAGRPPLNAAALVAAARHRLGARADVRAAFASSRETGDRVLLTGGAVRDAFLAALEPGPSHGSGRDLDLALPAGRATPFAADLARRLGSKVVAIGAPPRRILHIPLAHGEVDVWEREADIGRDLYRRDFTVNALSFELPSWSFLAPAPALEDLRRRRLALPRAGVLLEDPLRVLRAARFLAELRGFRIDASARPELRRAARRLGSAAAERRLDELDRILAARPVDAASALRFLEASGALKVLLGGATSQERRQGVVLVGGMPRPSAAVARVLLLSPLGDRRADEVLRSWKAPKRARQLAARLLPLAASLRRPARPAPRSRREVVEALRSVSPFFEESLLFLRALPGSRAARLAESLVALSRNSRRRARLLRPRRPLDAVAELLALGVEEGPRLGALLADLDVALAAGELRGARAARRFLAAGAAPPR